MAWTQWRSRRLSERQQRGLDDGQGSSRRGTGVDPTVVEAIEERARGW
jgi:hypothetical protein